MSLVELGFQYFPDPTKGRPVHNGFIYIGKPGTDPVIAGNQKTVTLRQESGVEVSASQPIRTGAGGVAVLNGSPVQVLVDGNYSLSVLNSKSAQVYYIPNSTGFSAVGDGIVDDTAAMSDFFSNGGGYVPEGTYLIDPIAVTNRVDVECHPNAVFKRRSGINGTDFLINLTAGSEFSTWKGGVVDGNRLALKATYDGFGSPIWAEFSMNAADQSVDGLTVKNGINIGFLCDGADRANVGVIETDFCASNQISQNDSMTLTRLTARNADNDGSATFVRGLTISTCTDSHFGDIAVYDIGGDTATVSGSDTVTAFVGLDMDNCSIQSISVNRMTDDIDHLGVSFLTVRNSNIGKITVVDYAGTAFEAIACEGTIVDDVLIDAMYHSTSHSAATSNVGIISHFGGFYPIGNRGREVTRAFHPMIISNGIVKRCGLGVHARAGGVTWDNVRVQASLGSGWRVEPVLPSAGFSTLNNIPHGNKFIDCAAEYCDSEGLSIRAGDDLRVFGGEFSNNGQSTVVSASTRYGLGYSTPSVVEPVNNLVIKDPVCADTQNYTVTDGCSFNPATSGQNWPNSTWEVLTVTLINDKKFHLGQNVTITNLTGAGDATGKIIDLNRDEAIIQFASSTTSSSTGNTTALTGTWSGSGTTLTGIGSLATTELIGPFWITDGVEWRQVEDVDSDLSIIIDAAFTTPLSGSTLTKVSCDVVGIPSQRDGVRFASSNINSLYHDGIVAYGNTSTDLILSSIPVIKGMNQSQSEGYKTNTVTILDDGVHSFSITGVGGQILIDDGINTAAHVSYRSTASPLTNLVSSAGIAAVTTGALTGTTGADSTLTISVDSSNVVYIENRRGSTRTFTYTLLK